MSDALSYGHIVGLDLGKQADPSALALLQWKLPTPPRISPPLPCRQPPSEPPIAPVARSYDVPTLKRWPLGTPYTGIVDGVVKFFQTPLLARFPPLLVVDTTGVGEPVCEMVRERMGQAKLEGAICQVTITGGFATTQAGAGIWRVSKKTLVSVLLVLLGNRRLHVASDLPEAATLTRELQTFSVKITPAGNESFESWRERDHDDLVLAVALATWAAETLQWPLVPINPGPQRLAVR